jgi:hypothetical protein
LQVQQQLRTADVQVHDMFASGDKVCMRVSYIVSSDVVPGGMPGSSTSLETRVTAIIIVRVENGKSVESWHRQDAIGMMLACGYPIGH